MPYKDPEAKRANHRDYMAERLAKDPEFNAAHRRNVVESNRRVKERVAELISKFRQNGCIICGEKEPCCLQAHHVRGKKLYNLGDLTRGRHGVATVEAELAKCVCICANCHCKVHGGVVKLG
jgi:hypothetical protein